LFLQPCQKHDSRSAAVDDGGASSLGAVIAEKAAPKKDAFESRESIALRMERAQPLAAPRNA
jgi:hypothetical protein